MHEKDKLKYKIGAWFAVFEGMGGENMNPRNKKLEVCWTEQ